MVDLTVSIEGIRYVAGPEPVEVAVIFADLFSLAIGIYIALFRDPGWSGSMYEDRNQLQSSICSP